MARGRFGRRRRQATNLTSLIAQLVAQQRQAEDRAIFDAWQNGGMFKGKPVTDSAIRAYIVARRDGFGKDDPLYDEWNNRLIQTDFSIGEQKIALSFKQGKVGASAVAAFYRGQLSKIPKDSAFYRDVASRAAQWARSAGSAARGRARGRATAAIDGKLEKVYNRMSDYLTLEAVVTEYAKRAGFIAGNETLTDAEAQDIESLFAMGLPSPTGKGTITMEDYKASAFDYYKALGQDIALSEQAGRGTKIKRAARAKFLNQNLMRLNTVDDRVKYEAAREVYDDALARAAGDPYAEWQATEDYLTILGGIRDGALVDQNESRNDPEFIGGINNEINAIVTGKPTGPTVWDLQSSATESTPTSDMEERLTDANAIRGDIEMLDSGRAYLGQLEPGGPIAVIPLKPGAASDPFGRMGLDESYQPSIERSNGVTRVVWLRGEPIRKQVITNEAGEVIDPLSPGVQEGLRTGIYTASEVSDNDVAGYVFTSSTGKTKYGVIDPATGKMVFTESNPFTSPVINGIVFASDATVGEGGVYLPGTVTGNLSITGGPGTVAVDPYLTGSTVSAADLETIVTSGDPRFGRVDPDDVAAYRQRIALAEVDRRQKYQAQQDAFSIRDTLDGRAPAGRLGVRSEINAAVDAANATVKSAFNPGEMPAIKDTEWATPPAINRPSANAAPTPAPGAPPPAPRTGRGKGGSWDDPAPAPTTSGRGKGGSWDTNDDPSSTKTGRGKGGSWADPDPVAPIGKGGYTHR